MKIGIDVAQTCVERAGCAWYADGCARGIAAACPSDAIELYHHFGNWINLRPKRGLQIDAANVTAPLINMDAHSARQFWAARELGEPLPGKPDFVISQSYHAPRTPESHLIYTIFDLVFLTHPEFSTAATRLVCQRELLLALARASALIFISESTRHEFEMVFPGWLSKSGIRWTIAKPGCRFPRAPEPVPFRSDSPWLFVGSLEPRKNPDTLLDAYQLYSRSSRSPRPLLFAGGRGWNCESTHKRIAELSRTIPVRHLGYLSEAALQETITLSHALVFPSWHEGFGMPVLEAENLGLPVIASKRGALSEAAGDAAIFIDPTSAENIAGAMIFLDANPQKHRSMALNGLEHASRFGWNRTARAIISLLADL